MAKNKGRSPASLEPVKIRPLFAIDTTIGRQIFLREKGVHLSQVRPNTEYDPDYLTALFDKCFSHAERYLNGPVVKN